MCEEGVWHMHMRTRAHKHTQTHTNTIPNVRAPQLEIRAKEDELAATRAEVARVNKARAPWG